MRRNVTKDKERFAKFVGLLKTKLQDKSIAKEMGCSPFAVHYWRIKLGIPRPSLIPEPKKYVDRKFYPLEDELYGGEKVNAGLRTYAEYQQAESERRKRLELETLNKIIKRNK